MIIFQITEKTMEIFTIFIYYEPITQLLCLQHEKLPLSAKSALEKVSF